MAPRLQRRDAPCSLGHHGRVADRRQPRRTSSSGHLACSHARPIGDLRPIRAAASRCPSESGVEVALQVAAALAGSSRGRAGRRSSTTSPSSYSWSRQTTPRRDCRDAGGRASETVRPARRPWRTRARARSSFRRRGRARPRVSRAPRERAGRRVDRTVQPEAVGGRPTRSAALRRARRPRPAGPVRPSRPARPRRRRRRSARQVRPPLPVHPILELRARAGRGHRRRRSDRAGRIDDGRPAAERPSTGVERSRSWARQSRSRPTAPPVRDASTAAQASCRAVGSPGVADVDGRVDVRAPGARSTAPPIEIVRTRAPAAMSWRRPSIARRRLTPGSAASRGSRWSDATTTVGARCQPGARTLRRVEHAEALERACRALGVEDSVVPGTSRVRSRGRRIRRRAPRRRRRRPARERTAAHAGSITSDGWMFRLAVLESTRIPRASSAPASASCRCGGAALRGLVGDQLDPDEAALDPDVADLLVAVDQRHEQLDGDVVQRPHVVEHALGLEDVQRPQGDRAPTPAATPRCCPSTRRRRCRAPAPSRAPRRSASRRRPSPCRGTSGRAAGPRARRRTADRCGRSRS